MKQIDHKTTRNINGEVVGIVDTVVLINVTSDVIIESIILQDDGNGGSIFNDLGQMYANIGNDLVTNSHVILQYDAGKGETDDRIVQCNAISAGTIGELMFEFPNDATNPTLLLTGGTELRDIRLVIGEFMAIDVTLQYIAAGATAVDITANLGLQYVNKDAIVTDYTVNGYSFNEEITTDFNTFFTASLFIKESRKRIQFDDFLNGIYLWNTSTDLFQKHTHPNITCSIKSSRLEDWNDNSIWSEFNVTCTNLSFHHSDSDKTTQIFDMSIVNKDLLRDHPSLGSTTNDFAPHPDAPNGASNGEICRYFSKISAQPLINRGPFLEHLFASTDGTLSQAYTITFEITARKSGRNYALRTQTAMPGQLTINIRGMFISVVLVLIALTTTAVGVVYRRLKLNTVLQY